jgi:hypothetical protein
MKLTQSAKERAGTEVKQEMENGNENENLDY